VRGRLLRLSHIGCGRDSWPLYKCEGKASPFELAFGVREAQYHPTLVSEPRLSTSLGPTVHGKYRFAAT